MSVPDQRRPAVVLAVLVLVLWPVVGGVAATPVPAPDGDGEPAGATLTVRGVAAVENNTTRHVDPEDRNEEGDLGMYRDWLAGRMSEALVDCTEGARADRLGACDLNTTYPDWLEQYADVAGETAAESDDRAAEAFEEARKDQREFANATREFRSLYERYRAAREAGNTTRARRLARQLRRQARRVRATARRLLDDYAVLANTTGANLTPATTAVAAVNESVAENVSAVEAELFVTTELVVGTNATVASVDRPVRLTGRWHLANGTAVANRPVSVRVGGQRVRARTDATGQFSVVYRPVFLPPGNRTVTVRAVPAPSSVFLPANATVGLNVSTVTPSVTVATDVDRVAFGENLTVGGTVAVDGRGVGSVPVVVRLGGVTLGRTRTATDGRFALTRPLPASVRAGNRTLVARVALANASLRPANASAGVEVVTTPTALTANASLTDDRRLRVAGRLRTVDGTGLPGRVLELRVNGTSVGTVETGPGGRYATEVTLSGNLNSGDGAGTTVRVAVQYDGSGTSLDASRATTTVSLPAVDDGASGQPSSALAFGLSATELGGVGLGVVFLGTLAFALAWRRRETGDERAPGGTDGTGDTGAGTTAPGSDDRTGNPLERAREVLAAGDADGAVTRAYAAVRDRLAAATETTPAATHWEFYLAARDRLDTDDADALEGLTEAYEAAAFAPGEVGADDAEEALAAATRLESSTVARSDGGADREADDAPTD